MFERIAGRSALTPIKPSDVFEDILIATRFSNKAIEHRANGYISICTFEHELNLVYMIKPTQAVQDYMRDTGYGAATIANITENINTVSFSTVWYSSSTNMQTTPQIAGVIAQEELEAYKATAKIQDDCIVKRAYADFRSQHPNYALVHHHSVTPLISRLARRVWIAVGHALKDDVILENARAGKYDSFYTSAEQVRFLHDEFDESVYLLREK